MNQLKTCPVANQTHTDGWTEFGTSLKNPRRPASANHHTAYPEITKLLEGLAPKFIAMVESRDIIIPRGMITPRAEGVFTDSGQEVFRVDQELYYKMGANNLDQMALTLNLLFFYGMNQEAENHINQPQPQRLKGRIINKRLRSSNITSFPIMNGIGTACSVTMKSFAVLLKLTHQQGMLNEESKDAIIRLHTATIHRMSLWDIKSVAGFEAQVCNSEDCIPSFDDMNFIQKRLPEIKAYTARPWSLKHFDILPDAFGIPRLAINQQFGEAGLQAMQSSVSKPHGCPFKTMIPQLIRPMLEAAWDAMAVPLINGDLLATDKKQRRIA